MMVWAGEGVDLIHSIENAAAIVGRIGAEAELCLHSAAGFLQPS